jgi:hypothetical protein
MLQFVHSARAGAVQKTKQVLKHDIRFRVCFLFEMWLADGLDRRAESALEAKQSSRSECFGGCCFEYAAKYTRAFRERVCTFVCPAIIFMANLSTRIYFDAY